MPAERHLSLWRSAAGALLVIGAAAGPARAQDIAPEAAYTPPPVLCYVTDSGRRIERAQLDKYQTARHRWLGGAVAATVGAGLVAFSTVLLLYSFTDDAKFSNVDVAFRGIAGVGMALGGVGVGVGAPFWYIGRRDLQAMEEKLPPYQPPDGSPALIGLNVRY